MARDPGIGRLAVGVNGHPATGCDDVHSLVDETLIAEAIGSCGCGLLLAEDGGPIVAANRSLCIFLGYRRRDLVGAALFDLAPALPPGVRIDGRDGFGRRIEWRQGDGTTLECPTWVLPTTIAGAAFLLVLVAPAAG